MDLTTPPSFLQDLLQAGKHLTSALDKELLVNLGGLITGMPNVDAISFVVCKALEVTRVLADISQLLLRTLSSSPQKNQAQANDDIVSLSIHMCTLTLDHSSAWS
jgi:hypothetical protein